MALTPGTRLGVYEVSAQFGECGMGEVCRATDTKLKRQVAIKILPAFLAADRDRLARFHREAQVLASLNHPNLTGALPLTEALPIAKQIAEALLDPPATAPNVSQSPTITRNAP